MKHSRYFIAASIISAIGSFIRSNEVRQGFHAAAFVVHGVSFLVAAPPGLGKSSLISMLRPEIDAVITDDWCDLEIENDGTCRAIQIDHNTSYNLTEETPPIEQAYGQMARVCRCGWRDKTFMPLEALGVRCKGSEKVDHIYFVIPKGTSRRDVDVYEILKIAGLTAPHTPFAGCEDYTATYGRERLNYYMRLLSVHRNGDVSIHIVEATDAATMCETVSAKIKYNVHCRIIEELLYARGKLIRNIGYDSQNKTHFQYPEASLPKICVENRMIAKRICDELLRRGVCIKTLFVHGSTGKGYGKVAPNIEWDFECKNQSVTMRTWVVSDCRDDVDIICICGTEWREYEAVISDVLKDNAFSGVDITLNLQGLIDIEAELRNPDSPALRRVLLMNSPEVLIGDVVFEHLCAIAKDNVSSYDWAHELDFRTLMCLSEILSSRHFSQFNFSDEEMISLFPTFRMAVLGHRHIGFPKLRRKLVRSAR